jgi:hypothetical protein
MMRILEMFTKEYWRALNTAPLALMGGCSTHKATTHTEE